MANTINYLSGTDAVVAAANKLDSLNDDFFSTYSEFYSLIEGDLMVNWKGEDSDAFRQRCNDTKPHFELMKEIIAEYAAFLRKTAFEHEKRMQESRDASKKLKLK